ncbi:MAG: hypothetical protein ACYDCH_10045 [Gaiellaceae bacterium]
MPMTGNMGITVSRPVAILALVALVGATAGGAMLLVTRARQAAPAAGASRPAPPARPARSAVRAPAPSHPKPAATARLPVSPVAANGLPRSLAAALRKHRVVVVSLFDPQAQTDAISYAEARAGARDAGVGFLPVSVLDGAVAGPLTASLPGGGLLPDPGLLIYRAPGTLVERFDGFLDRAAVAQAADAGRTAAPFQAAPAP